MSGDQKKKPNAETEMNRRVALARLGIGVALAYSAPVVLHLDRSANATLSTTPCKRGRNKPRWCRRKDRDKDHGHGHGNGHGKGHDKGKGKGHNRDHDRHGRSNGRNNRGSKNNRSSRRNRSSSRSRGRSKSRGRR